jgi:DNA-3-methyladenine glycosylase I
MKIYKKPELVSIFNAAEAKLFELSNHSKSKLVKALAPFKKMKIIERNDEAYFQLLVSVTFYSGFKAATVTSKLDSIKQVFKSIDKVAKFDTLKIQKIIDSKKVIGHRGKIEGIVHNAKQLKQIKREFKSFNNYLASFGDPNDDVVLFALAKDLRKRFKYLGGITVFHFLTDIGFNVVKPDRVLSRICYRLGLVDTEDDLLGVINAGRKFSAATNLPIRYIDIILVNYGQVDAKPEFGLTEGICLSKNPKCEICSLYKYCMFKHKKKK